MNERRNIDLRIVPWYNREIRFPRKLSTYLKGLTWTVLVGSITIQADPFHTWNWIEPTSYVNNQVISSSDTLSYTLYCNDQPDESGPPYEVLIPLDDPGAPPSYEDMALVVQDRVGTFYCVGTTYSSLYKSESIYSDEANFTVTSGDLGFVPNPPTNLTLQ